MGYYKKLVLKLRVYCMKNLLVKVSRTLFIPICALMICFNIFFYYLVGFPGLLVIQLILFFGCLLTSIGCFLDLFGKSTKNKKLRMSNNPVVRYFYSHSRGIITSAFCYYIFIYALFSLARESIYYSYLVLLLFGLFLGYEIALIANRYKK